MHPSGNSYTLSSMNIVLMGYRGTGKSVIGRLLARRLDRQLFSLDRIIEQKGGMGIPEFVARFGWPKFRELECEVVQEVCDQADQAILDCGGGVVLDQRNVDRLKRRGHVVLLTAEFNILLERLSRDQTRPSLLDGVSFEEEQKQIMEQRQEKYKNASDFICDTSYVKPERTVKEIIYHFKEKKWI